MKNVFKKVHGFEKGKGIVSEGWSNSDSKDLELEEFFEDRFSQISYFGTIDTGTPTTGRRENDSFCLKDEDEGFIQVLDKKKGVKRWKESHGNHKYKKDCDHNDKPKHEKNKKQDYGTVSYSKGKDKNTTLTYEVKNKSEKNKDTLPKGSVAKIILPVQTKSPLVNQTVGMKQSPYFPPLSTPSENKAVTASASSNVTQNKLVKGKALSLKSPSLEIGTIKSSKAREIARKYFDKKLERDILDYVAYLTEESNKMMPYRMLVHSRIDYCLKKLFTGKL